MSLSKRSREFIFSRLIHDKQWNCWQYFMFYLLLVQGNAWVYTQAILQTYLYKK